MEELRSLLTPLSENKAFCGLSSVNGSFDSSSLDKEGCYVKVEIHQIKMEYLINIEDGETAK